MCWLQLLCINFEFGVVIGAAVLQGLQNCWGWRLYLACLFSVEVYPVEGKGRILESEPVTAEEKMKKGIHPQMQWISYVTQSGRLMHVMMTKIHQAGKVYHFRARRQMAESVGQVAKFKRRYGQMEEEKEEESK
ncbi:hypothetical protein L2E82_46139 [Cichorium intybus]|uniref:Uncharacterized protein n=1 Tax=Cichorium intybus TaxID=13427 RepID=A0ACB8YTW5_CICIN|nr:hypothetical protein L2E82_46139 [Cichorium intybus]